jgi:anti-sigma B factor antagonist
MPDDGNLRTRLSEYCSISDEQHLDTTIARLDGEFDLASEERFREERARLLAREETATLMLDLRGLDFIDSTGLRMLVETDALARQDGFDLAVVCGEGQVRMVLKVSGLEGVLPLVGPEAIPAPEQR